MNDIGKYKTWYTTFQIKFEAYIHIKYTDTIFYSNKFILCIM